MVEGLLETQHMDPRLQQETMASESVCHRVGRELGFKIYRGAVVYPGVSRKGYGGVADSTGKCIHNTSVFNGCRQYGVNTECPVVSSDESVVYLGMLYGCWGHCLTDCLQRFWVFGTKGVHPAVHGKKFVYAITDWRAGLPQSFYDLIAILGVSKEQLSPIEKPTRFNEVIIPDSCFYHNLETGHIEYTNEYVSLIDLLRVSASGVSRKVYFSRKDWAGSLSFGEERFESLFRARGYEIVYPEKLTFDEQRKLLAETKELVATEGSVAHNAIFMPKGSRVVILRKARYVNRYQSVVNEIAGLEPVYVDANMSHLLFIRSRPFIGPFFLYVNSRLASFLGCKPSFPVFTYLRYVAFYLSVKGRSLLHRMGLIKS